MIPRRVVGPEAAFWDALDDITYQLDELEVAALAQGGTLWLSTWGGLPVHKLDVVDLNRIVFSGTSLAVGEEPVNG